MADLWLRGRLGASGDRFARSVSASRHALRPDFSTPMSDTLQSTRLLDSWRLWSMHPVPHNRHVSTFLSDTSIAPMNEQLMNKAVERCTIYGRESERCDIDRAQGEQQTASDKRGARHEMKRSQSDGGKVAVRRRQYQICGKRRRSQADGRRSQTEHPYNP